MPGRVHIVGYTALLLWPGFPRGESTPACPQVWPELSDAEMMSVFAKVDASANGLVPWDEFLSFMVRTPTQP